MGDPVFVDEGCDELLHEALVGEECLVASVVVVWHKTTIAQGVWEGKVGRGNRVRWGSVERGPCPGEPRVGGAPDRLSRGDWGSGPGS